MAQAQDIALDVDSILAIHRHDDGNVAICRKRQDGSLDQMWMLTPDMLRGTFRAFQEWLLDNAHFSLQAFRRTAPKGWVHKPTGLPAVGVDKHHQVGQRRFGRVTENLRYLNCFSCDVDCGRSEQDAKNDLEKVPWREAQRRIENLQDAGHIPPISMMGYSGRGLYVIWLIHDDRNPLRSAPAYDHDVVTWKRVQKELVSRTENAPLPVDHAGSLVTQVYKIGVTLNPKSGKRAEWFVYFQGGAKGRLISYTISEMAHFLDLPALDGDLPDSTRKRARPAQCRKAKKSVPARSEGYYKRFALLAGDLLTIERDKDGWRKRGTPYADGHRTPKYGRRLLLTIYAQSLIRSMYSPRKLRPPLAIAPGDKEDVLSRLRTMAAQCVPPYPSDQNDVTPDVILDTVLSQYKPGPDGKQRLPPVPSGKTLCAAFGITADVANELDLKTIMPDEVKDERYRARPHQGEVIQARRDFARQYIERYGVPTARKLANAYKVAGFPGSNHETANQDLNALGYVVARSTGGRPRKVRK